MVLRLRWVVIATQRGGKWWVASRHVTRRAALQHAKKLDAMPGVPLAYEVKEVFRSYPERHKAGV